MLGCSGEMDEPRVFGARARATSLLTECEAQEKELVDNTPTSKHSLEFIQCRDTFELS